MSQKMSICPNCGWAVYGGRVVEVAGYLEIDCPRCGIQEREFTNTHNDMSWLDDLQAGHSTQEASCD